MTPTWRIFPRPFTTCGVSWTREGGTCIAYFRPSVVANVHKSTGYRLIWTPLRARFVRQESQSG